MTADPTLPLTAAGIALERCGRGAPLLLLHGTGGSRYHWTPVVPLLSARRQLLLVDLPGHGRSDPPPPGVPHTAAGYAQLLARLFDELGLDSVHIAGNSMGGWTALELAKLGRARSVVALAPAGLWSKRPPLATTARLRIMYRLARLCGPALPTLLRARPVRRLAFGGLLANSSELPAEAATELASAYTQMRGFDLHLATTRSHRFRDGRSIEVPVTVAWGAAERLIPPASRLALELPSHTRYITLPGCGHLAMWDDPKLVANAILDGTSGSPRTATD